MERKKRELYADLPKRDDPNYISEYRKKNKDRLRQKEKQRLEKLKIENPNYYKDKYDPIAAKQYRESNKKEISEKQWSKRGIIDITYEKYLLDLQTQNGKCAICNIIMTKPQTDHNHITGKYRALLCVPCNNGLGVYEKKKELFEEYLRNKDE